MTKKSPMPYMKLHLSYLDDLRLNQLPEAVRYMYFQLYMLAFRADAGGDVIDPETGNPLSTGDISFILRTNADSISTDVEQLMQSGLITEERSTWRIARYEEEQVNQTEYRRATAERVARFRKKPKENESKELIVNSKDKVKSNNEVTRYSHVTENEPTASSVTSFSENPAFSKAEYMVNTSITIREAEMMLLKVSKLAAMPRDQEAYVDTVQAMIIRHGEEVTLTALTRSCDKWTATQGKNGKMYSRTNFKWVDWALDSIGEREAPKSIPLEKPTMTCPQLSRLYQACSDAWGTDSQEAQVEQYKKHILGCTVCGNASNAKIIAGEEVDKKIVSSLISQVAQAKRV